MIIEGPFTDKLRRRSQKYFYLYNLLNGASYMCLGETIIILLALKLKCRATATGHPPRQTRYAISARLRPGHLAKPTLSPDINAPRLTEPEDSNDSQSDIGRIFSRTMRPVPE